MSYDILVYRLGKLYGQLLQQSPKEEFPEYTGQLSDFLDQDTFQILPELQGEHIIAYNNGNGINHFIRVYFDEETFELAGTPAPPSLFGLTGVTFQD